MTRKKVKLAYISNDSARKATYKKRKKGLVKKVSELSTLCGIQACAIIYSPYESQPEVWPSPVGVQRVLAEFKKRSEMDQSKKMLNQESYLRQRIGKANEQLMKQRKENREKEMTQVMFQSLVGRVLLHNLNMLDLNDLGWLIEQNLKDIHKRVDTLNKASDSTLLGTGAAAATVEKSGENVVQAAERSSGPVHANVDIMQKQQWMMDMMNNPQEHLGFDPFGENNHNALWSNAFFPWEK